MLEQIFDSEGNVVEEWDSTTETHVIEGLKTGEEYTLKETVAPEGYQVTTDTTFTIDETGKVTSTGTTTTDEEGNTILLVEDVREGQELSILFMGEGAGGFAPCPVRWHSRTVAARSRLIHQGGQNLNIETLSRERESQE